MSRVGEVAMFLAMLLCLVGLGPAVVAGAAAPAMKVEVSDPCANLIDDPGYPCYRGLQLKIEGNGFAPNSTVSLFMTGLPGVAELPEKLLYGRKPVDSTGHFAVKWYRTTCIPVPDYDSLTGLFWVYASDYQGKRLALWPLPRDKVVCKPPFVLNRQKGCRDDQETCTWLTAGNASTVWVRWTAGPLHNRFRVSYGVIGQEGTIVDKYYGRDVTAVPVNNLTAGTAYWFEVQPCLAVVVITCKDGWLPTGDAAP